MHFVAFFHVASLFVREVENRKVGVDNKKALELTNSSVFHRGRQQKSSRADKWNNFLMILPVWVQLMFWASFQLGSTSGWGSTSGLDPLPVEPTSGWGPLPVWTHFRFGSVCPESRGRILYGRNLSWPQPADWCCYKIRRKVKIFMFLMFAWQGILSGCCLACLVSKLRKNVGNLSYFKHRCSPSIDAALE